MHELNERTTHLLEQKIEEVINKGDISPSEMCCIKDAYETLYYMQATETMDEYGEDSYRGTSMRMNPMNRNWNSYRHPYETDGWMDDGSMRRGRGSDGRYTSVKGGSSYHSVNDRIIANLEKELDHASSDFERQKILDEIRRIREMKD